MSNSGFWAAMLIFWGLVSVSWSIQTARADLAEGLRVNALVQTGACDVDRPGGRSLDLGCPQDKR